uniref:Uncharacterized protein n=1 Tax=Lygus hesperus TaxID=30085 RepID=A0A146LGT8_LYGHE
MGNPLASSSSGSTKPIGHRSGRNTSRDARTTSRRVGSRHSIHTNMHEPIQQRNGGAVREPKIRATVPTFAEIERGGRSGQSSCERVGGVEKVRRFGRGCRRSRETRSEVPSERATGRGFLHTVAVVAAVYETAKTICTHTVLLYRGTARVGESDTICGGSDTARQAVHSARNSTSAASKQADTVERRRSTQCGVHTVFLDIEERPTTNTTVAPATVRREGGWRKEHDDRTDVVHRRMRRSSEEEEDGERNTTIGPMWCTEECGEAVRKSEWSFTGPIALDVTGTYGL